VVQVSIEMLVLLIKEILYHKDEDLQQYIVAAVPAPGVEVVSGSSPQCPLAHGSPEL
jgi:hypothetical protein